MIVGLYIFVATCVRINWCMRGCVCVHVCMHVYMYANQQMWISPATGRSSKLKHTDYEIETCTFQTCCQLSSAASDVSLGLCFWHNFSRMNRSCLTTGSWWCCYSLELVSWICARSAIIFRFLYGFICVFLCQNTKIKPPKYLWQHITQMS